MAAQQREQTSCDAEETDRILGDIVNARYFQHIYFIVGLHVINMI